MSCEPFATALVDESASSPPGLEAHLSRCEDCRALSRLHTSARRLRLAEPPLPTVSFTPASIAGVVRRRRRAWAAGAGATCAVALLALLTRTPALPETLPSEEFAQGAPVEGVIQAAPTASVSSDSRGQQVELGSLLQELLLEVEGYTHNRPALEDPAYEPFGLLALWVRPPESNALDAEPFRSALWALQPSRSQ